MQCLARIICGGAAPVARKQQGPAGACPWATESVAFKRWVTDAVTQNGAERAELYAFLTECFKDADSDRDGFVNAEEFDFLVEKAAALPRRFGLAPSWKALYGDVATRQSSRAKLFHMVDAERRNLVGIDNWIQYAFWHIAEKVQTMPMRTMDFENLQATGKSGFLQFLRTAVSNRTSVEYQELYQFLFKNFVLADTDQKGSVTFEQFDHLVELSANAPRSLDLAPPTEKMFKSNGERRAARKKLFDSMDADKGGAISFDEYLKYTITHIAEKVSSKAAEEPVFAAPKWQTTASAFAPWVRKAIEQPRSEERRELYTFLSDCFMDADADRDGFVNSEEFDFLCEKAAALPRRFGLAPSWRDLYSTVEGRQVARLELFKKVDSSKRGTIGMDDWIQYSFKHIEEKVKGMHKETIDFGNLQKSGKDKFIAFLKTATTDKKSRENTELYQFLFNNFVLADKEAKGAVTAEQFDYLVELSADAPRALGLAPKSSDMFGSDAERLASRKRLFAGMDRDGGGTITFDEYLSYTMTHIAEKVQNTGGKCPMGFA
mmetsp:Transcript_51735/g.147475  ORF Transcript_51735/g.147475 Transcript_51735/m.147475 type:complete len:547 (+) Transcript_51735:118-1758(+)|eukprot:CAMPEP_0168399628 /NCGR_PEP_ID=MMETSP0228-20121227/22183_1 /TAXON_ID=133427 /ORGANISM="Protoceratium reticulatum, Strain CCCM 535 (=CCMP 1889)" /LENGTH=546 /DNA_ID=CAMNT_0008413149 /DNA_START=111 /DNA_END=1751 /DNA_ORIENTATION=-